MAAFAPLKSAQYTAQTAEPAALVSGLDWGPKLNHAYGKLTFTAAGNSADLAQVIRMPAGKVRILTDLCRIICPIGTATADLHVGYGAYVNAAGTAVAADDNALADNLDVGGAAIDEAFSLPAGGFLEIESQAGFDIVAFIDTANSPAAGDLVLSVVYAKIK